MQEIKTFTSEFGELNVLEIEGKSYFPGTQCARILGYKQPAKAVRETCDLEGCLNRTVLTPGGPQRIKLITEGNLYRLIIKSKLPLAKKFERWVFDEVLPSIRRSGEYKVPEAKQSLPEPREEFKLTVGRDVIPRLLRAMADELEKIEEEKGCSLVKTD